jgi:hypothetical protein
MCEKSNVKGSLGVWLILLIVPAASFAGKIIYVDNDGPADFNSIQPAINDANDGDTILVADGTYRGNGNRDIDFKGKAIALRSQNGPHNCIIDCNGTKPDPHRGFYFHSREDTNCVLDGFTVLKGYAPEEEFYGYIWSLGGAIYCNESGPIIRNCLIKENHASMAGGGVFSWRSGPALRNCIFSGNSAYIGGGVCSSGGVINNCVFSGNKAIQGGGVFCHSSDAIGPAANGQDGASGENEILPLGSSDGRFSQTIINSTFIGNKASSKGMGVFCSGFTALISNCIVWGYGVLEGDEIPLVFVSCDSSLSVRHSDVQGGQASNGCGCDERCHLDWGPGNMDADSCFAKAGYWDPNGTPNDADDDFWVEGDYHLKSQAGRWEPLIASWIKDDVTSPCIDAGNPSSPIGLEPFPNGGIINMGAYGGTAEASKSYFGKPVCETIVAGDINGDCKVDFKDFALMAYHWLEDNR